MTMPNEEWLQLKNSITKELWENIVPFWQKYGLDSTGKKIIGKLSNDSIIQSEADVSLILATRLLWSFSALYRARKMPEYLSFAEHIYNILIDSFYDKDWGGFFWMIDHRGEPVDTKKKFYGQAFAIYSLVEYYFASGEAKALEQAKQVYHLIEKHSFDPENGGYFEAGNRDWTLAEDLRLSKVDMNEKKSMNTHLHIIEAYTNLYRAWPDPDLKKQVTALLDIFLDYIIDPDTTHFRLFFDESWNSKSENVSFGHDIEGSWLLTETCHVLDDQPKLEKVQEWAVKAAKVTALESLSPDNGIYYEREGDGEMVKKYSWWVQAEAMVGFFNAYQISKDSFFLDLTQKIWDFIMSYTRDTVHGEWFYMINNDLTPSSEEFKICEWKGPYHNSRACLEMINRINQIT